MVFIINFVEILVVIYIDIYFLERICRLHCPFQAGPVLKLTYFGLFLLLKNMQSLKNSDNMKMLMAAQRAGISTYLSNDKGVFRKNKNPKHTPGHRTGLVNYLFIFL